MHDEYSYRYLKDDDDRIGELGELAGRDSWFEVLRFRIKSILRGLYSKQTYM